MSHSGKISEIKKFWNNNAETHSADLKATTPDPLLKKIELESLIRALDPDLNTLEAGCGNGYNLLRLSKTLTSQLVGFDYSSKMIEAAPKGCRQMSFHEADILGDLSSFGTFGQAFTDRCLINLPSHDLQIEAARNLASRVKPGGTLVFLECFKGPLTRLNEMRVCANLEPIKEHWHNSYLEEEPFLKAVSEFLELVEVDRFSSLYYLASRVFNAKLTPEGKAPDYLSDINKISSELPSIGDFGPHILFKFRRHKHL